MQARVADQIADLQSQIDALNKQIDSASRATRQNLTAQRDGLQGQMEVISSWSGATEFAWEIASAYPESPVM